MDLLLSEAMHVAKKASQRASTVLRDMLLTASVREKAPKDLVTDADIAAQDAIESTIRECYPSHRFLGEESGAILNEFQGVDAWTWVVDPLDGTMNYVHKLPNFAVSIALMKSDRIVLGVVQDPMSGEVYSAIEHEGATVNGVPLKVSGCQSLGQAMVAASFPPQVTRESPEVKQFVEVLVRSQSLRRLGSAALNLCYVGQGRLDAYWANRLKPWDVAAGALIATEAGAVLTNLTGKKFDPWSGEVLIAASQALSEEMQSTIHGKCLLFQ
jgi:myo-inositol-1(or 4)-monophosphatase